MNICSYVPRVCSVGAQKCELRALRQFSRARTGHLLQKKALVGEGKSFKYYSRVVQYPLDALKKEDYCRLP